MHDRGVVADPSTYQVEESKVFVVCSALKPSKMAIRVLGQGKEVSFSVDQFLNKNQVSGEPFMFNSRFGKLLPEEFSEYLKESVPGKRLEDLLENYRRVVCRRCRGSAFEDLIQFARQFGQCSHARGCTFRLQGIDAALLRGRRNFEAGDKTRQVDRIVDRHGLLVAQNGSGQVVQSAQQRRLGLSALDRVQNGLKVTVDPCVATHSGNGKT